MLSCVNLLDLYAYYTLVRVLSWLYFNTIYCVYIIKLIIYSYPLIQTFCAAPRRAVVRIFILLFLKGIKISDMLMSFPALI